MKKKNTVIYLLVALVALTSISNSAFAQDCQCCSVNPATEFTWDGQYQTEYDSATGFNYSYAELWIETKANISGASYAGAAAIWTIHMTCSGPGYVQPGYGETTIFGERVACTAGEAHVGGGDSHTAGRVQAWPGVRYYAGYAATCGCHPESTCDGDSYCGAAQNYIDVPPLIDGVKIQHTFSEQEFGCPGDPKRLVVGKASKISFYERIPWTVAMEEGTKTFVFNGAGLNNVRKTTTTMSLSALMSRPSVNTFSDIIPTQPGELRVHVEVTGSSFKTIPIMRGDCDQELVPWTIIGPEIVIPVDDVPCPEPCDDPSQCCSKESPVSQDGCGYDECGPQNFGKPVDALTGFSWLVANDFQISMPAGPDFVMERSYSTAWAQGSGGTTQIGMLGPGWSNTFETRLELSGSNAPANMATLRHSNTRTEVYYKQTASNEYRGKHPLKQLYWFEALSSYVLEFSDSSKYIFDSRGRLKQSIDANGGENRFYRAGDTDGDCPVSETHPEDSICYVDSLFGQRLWLHYSESPLRLIKITLDAAGNEVLANYEYTEGYLTRAVAKGVETNYEYDYTHTDDDGIDIKLLTAVKDADGIISESFIYDRKTRGMSRVTKHATQTDWYEFTYDLNGYKTLIYSSEGNTELKWKNGHVQSTCHLDSNGICDPNKRVEYTYSTYTPKSLSCLKTIDGYQKMQRDELGRLTLFEEGLNSCSDNFGPTTIETAYLEQSNKRAFERMASVDASAPSNFKTALVWDYSTSQPCSGEGCFNPATYNSGTLSSQLQKLVRIGRTYRDTDKIWESRAETTKYEYNGDGQIARVVPANGSALEFSYYPTSNNNPNAGRLHRVKQGDSTLVEYADYTALGLPKTVTDESGIALHLIYDEGGRVISTQRQGIDAATTYQYHKGEISEIQLPLGNRILWSYDAKGRIESIQWLSSAGAVVEEIRYERKDQLSGTAKTNGRVISETYLVNGQELRKVQYDYDERGRRNATLHLKNASDTEAYQLTRFDENDRIVGVADARHLEKNASPSYANSKNVEHLYNKLGQLSEIRRFVDQEWVSSGKFEYDTQGNTTEIVDGCGLSSKYTYDDFGRLVRVKLPDSRERIYVYDISGNLIKEKTADGTIIERTYDSRNRLTSVNYDGITETYSYGTNPDSSVLDCATKQPLPNSNGKGRVTQIQDQAGTLHVGYDLHGAKHYEARVLTNATCARTIFWTRNENGQIASIRYPSGHQVEYVYETESDIRHLPRQLKLNVEDDSVVLADSIDIGAGDILEYTAGNGLNWSMTWKLNGSPVKMEVKSDSESLYSRDYSTDRAGSPTQYLDKPDQDKQDFSYELAFGYLESSNTETWTYSLAGDRLSENDDSYIYEDGTHKLTRIQDKNNQTTRQYTYGNSGAVWTIQDNEGNRTFCYDSKDQFKKYVGAHGEVLDQIYDYSHRRIATIGPVNNYRQDYRFDGVFLMEEQRDASFVAAYPRQTIEYIWMNGRAIAAIHSEENADGSYSKPKISYLFSGHLNEVLIEADETGKIIYRHLFEAFGKKNVVVVAEANREAVRLGYPGQYQEPETGLIENWYRYYDPEGGQYLQTEPLYREPMLVRDYAEAGIVMNSYAYAVNNPLRFVDPDGEIAIPIPAFAAAGAVGAILLWKAYTDACMASGTCPWSKARPIFREKTKEKERTKEICEEQPKPKCPPCPEPSPPVTDYNHSHGGHQPHWYYFVYNQNPTTCECFEKRVFGGPGVAP